MPKKAQIPSAVQRFREGVISTITFMLVSRFLQKSARLYVDSIKTVFFRQEQTLHLRCRTSVGLLRNGSFVSYGLICILHNSLFGIWDAEDLLIPDSQVGARSSNVWIPLQTFLLPAGEAAVSGKSLQILYFSTADKGAMRKSSFWFNKLWIYLNLLNHKNFDNLQYMCYYFILSWMNSGSLPGRNDCCSKHLHIYRPWAREDIDNEETDTRHYCSRSCICCSLHSGIFQSRK